MTPSSSSSWPPLTFLPHKRKGSLRCNISGIKMKNTLQILLQNTFWPQVAIIRTRVTRSKEFKPAEGKQTRSRGVQLGGAACLLCLLCSVTLLADILASSPWGFYTVVLIIVSEEGRRRWWVRNVLVVFSTWACPAPPRPAPLTCPLCTSPAGPLGAMHAYSADPTPLVATAWEWPAHAFQPRVTPATTPGDPWTPLPGPASSTLHCSRRWLPLPCRGINAAPSRKV